MTMAMTTTPEIFSYLNFLLAFCPTDPSEKDLMRDLRQDRHRSRQAASTCKTLAPDMRKALQDGIDDGVKEFEFFKRTELDTRKVGTPALFGTREHLENNYLYRYAAAQARHLRQLGRGGDLSRLLRSTARRAARCGGQALCAHASPRTRCRRPTPSGR